MTSYMAASMHQHKHNSLRSVDFTKQQPATFATSIIDYQDCRGQNTIDKGGDSDVVDGAEVNRGNFVDGNPTSSFEKRSRSLGLVPAAQRGESGEDLKERGRGAEVRLMSAKFDGLFGVREEAQGTTKETNKM